MNVSVLSSSLPERWQPRVLLHNLISIVGYALLVETLVTASFVVQNFFGEVEQLSAAEAFHNFMTQFPLCALVMVTSALLTGIGVHLAPRNGVWRWISLITTGVLTTLWAWRAIVFLGLGDMDPSDIFEYLFVGLFLAYICDYHRSARGSETLLRQAQLEALSLDTEFNRAHLDLLRAQIEPHFLFNTLATVRALARRDRAAASAMLDNLMRYFAAALPKMRQDKAPLREELDLLEAYLEIHRLRMGTRLAYEVQCARELRDLPVPTMILLTLIENAIKHGINPAVGGGLIRVSVALELSTVTLRVADSGRGMQSQLGHGTGLANIRTRLSLLYGGRATLALRNLQPHGVEAIVRLPFEGTP